jgi:peptidylprolyl isomerase
LAIVMLMALFAGSGDAVQSTGSAEPRTGATVASEAGSEASKTKPKVQVPKGPPPTELEVEDLVEGNGAEAKAGDEVTVHYVLLLYKGGKELDSSWDRGAPYSFELGSGKVTAGWEQGIEGMKAGGRRELIAPGNLSYGKEGRPPTVGPNETLVSVIDLLAVK